MVHFFASFSHTWPWGKIVSVALSGVELFEPLVFGIKTSCYFKAFSELNGEIIIRQRDAHQVILSEIGPVQITYIIDDAAVGFWPASQCLSAHESSLSSIRDP